MPQGSQWTLANIKDPAGNIPDIRYTVYDGDGTIYQDEMS